MWDVLLVALGAGSVPGGAPRWRGHCATGRLGARCGAAALWQEARRALVLCSLLCLGAVPPNTLPAQPGAVLVLPAQVMLLPGGAALRGLRWSLAADLGIG